MNNSAKMTYNCVLPEGFVDKDTKLAIEVEANCLLGYCPEALPLLLAGGSIVVKHGDMLYKLSLKCDEIGGKTMPVIATLSKTPFYSVGCTLTMSIMPVFRLNKDGQ
jgi:hypothetical protein